METTKTETQEAQGAEAKKTQAPSKTYTLKQFQEMIEKLKKFGWLTEEETKQLQKIREKAKQEYIKSL